MSEEKGIIRKRFFCPLGAAIMWHRGLEYKDCPLCPAQRDMSECKECKLRVDVAWETSKETWQDKPVKKKRRPPKRKNKKGKKPQGDKR